MLQLLPQLVVDQVVAVAVAKQVRLQLTGHQVQQAKDFQVVTVPTQMPTQTELVEVVVGLVGLGVMLQLAHLSLFLELVVLERLLLLQEHL
jgi:hypothetical protein